MAVVNSIMGGKSTGKIGNAVFSVINGQTVSKQLNLHPRNPQTVAQTANRLQMKNAVLVYQLLSTFLAYFKAPKKSVESIYNAFVRLFKAGFANDALYATVADKVSGMIAAMGLYLGNFVTITGFDPANPANLSFTTGGLPYPVNAYARYWNYAVDGTVTVGSVAITEAQWNAGAVPIPDLVAAENEFLFYIYTSDGTKNSNIFGLEV